MTDAGGVWVLQAPNAAAQVHVDLDRGSCRVDGEDVRLTPRLASLLRAVVERQGEVVDRDALRREVWEGSQVSEDTVHQAMHRLRYALGDRTEPPMFIAAARGRGYRVVARILRHGARSEPPVPAPTSPRGQTPAEALREALHEVDARIAVMGAAGVGGRIDEAVQMHV